MNEESILQGVNESLLVDAIASWDGYRVVCRNTNRSQRWKLMRLSWRHHYREGKVVLCSHSYLFDTVQK